MSFYNLPAELRAIPQWTVYRNEIRGTEVTKPPLRIHEPMYGASVHDPSHWGTFEEAVALYEANNSILSGIGFCLTEADPYVVIDLDKIEKVEVHHRPARQAFEEACLSLHTYTELSPSGRGWHVWMRAKLNYPGRHLDKVGGEIYAFQRFMTCTGRPVGLVQSGPVKDCADFIRQVGLADRPPEETIEDNPHKPCDLSDNEVVELACRRHGSFAARFAGTMECGPGEWSHTFTHVVGTLEAVCGNVEQIRRIVSTSGMVLNATAATTGESRADKCLRTFNSVFARVRGGNRAMQDQVAIEHGRQIWQAIQARDAEIANEMARDAERRIAEVREAEEVARKDGVIDLRGSKSAAEVLKRFAPLGGDPMHLTVPPGIMGEMVMASMRANPVPYLKYALPAALSVMSGIVARAYAPDRGGPLNMNYILVAPSSTGKTVSMDVWEDVLGLVMTSPQVQSGNRLVKNQTMSVQGIWPVFEEVPCCAWFIEEASGQFNAMSSPKNSADENLRNFYNELYDSGKHNKVSNLPRSAASRNAGMNGIRKLCVSTYWTTTPDKFEMRDTDIKDGFASRVVFVHHDQPGGLKSRYFDPNFPHYLLDRLALMLNIAGQVDNAYKSANPAVAEALITKVDTTQIDDAWWALDVVCDLINREAIRGELPKAYQMLSRIPMNARRMACALAIVENPTFPVVTLEQLTWCHNYLMHNAIGLLAGMDAGEVGDNTSDEVMAAKRVWTELVKKGAMSGLPGIPQTLLVETMAKRTPFRSHRNGRTKSAADCVRLMVEQHIMHEMAGVAPTRGRPARYLVLATL